MMYIKLKVIRKIDGMVPAIVYGDEKETINIKLKLNELTKASENELFSPTNTALSLALVSAV